MFRTWIALLIIVAGCGVDEAALPTLPAAGGAEECPEALLGPVVLEERSDAPGAPVVAVVAGAEATELVWARGFTAEFEPLRIRDAAGEEVARAGDEVWLMGGSTADDRFFVCGISDRMP